MSAYPRLTADRRTRERIALISEHASPLAAIGSEDAGGQNVHVAALAASLAERGHEVVVYTRRDDPGPAESVQLCEGVRVEHLDAGPARPIPKDGLRPLVPAMSDELLRRWSTGWQPTIAHAHFWMSGLAALPAAAALGIPLVQTFHALGVVKRRMQGELDGSPADRLTSERELAAGVTRIIATCRDEVSELRGLGVTDDRVDVVPCGVDVHQFRPHGKQSESGRFQYRLLTVGRLVRRKGVDTVVDALERLPDAELVIAGGPAREALETDIEVRRLKARARARGVAERISFAGSVDRRTVAQLMRSADLVVCPAWYEPFGIVPLEAMACGTPVITSAVGGMLDTVRDGETGRLVPARRPELLASAIRELLDDVPRRNRMGAAGVRRVRDRYTWQHVAALTEQSYARSQAAHLASRRRELTELTA